MLRQLAELNSGRLMLARFVMEDGKLQIEYHCPLELTHPDKIASLFRNICYVGDYYDDEFCNKFGATRIYEPQIRPYSDEDIQRVYEAFKQTSQKAIEDAEQSVKDRNLGEAWAQISMAFSQFEYYAQPKGGLESECENALEELDAELPIPERVSIASRKLEAMMARPIEEFAKDLYYTQSMCSLKSRATTEEMQEVFENSMDVCVKAGQAEDYAYIVTRLTHNVYKAYNLYDMPEYLNAHFVNALSAAGGKPVKEAAEILFTMGKAIMEDEVDEKGSVSGGASSASSAAAAGIDMQEIEALQKAMMDAMAKGDMQEYMRIAMEMQQKMMSQNNA